MPAPVGSYASLGIPDFGRLFEFRWGMQRHYSRYSLASVVARLFVVFHCALDQGTFIQADDSVFSCRSKRGCCAGVDDGSLTAIGVAHFHGFWRIPVAMIG